MPFIPATPGIVGFGGGSKPAIFQAVAPQYSLMNQQTDDDGPFTRCHDALGDTLNYATSGVLACGGCYALPNALGPDRDIHISLSGTNGSGTVAWNGTSAWLASAGTVTITTFASTDLSCSGASFDTTTTAGLVVTCLGDNQMGAGIIAGPVTILGFSWSLLIFDAVSREALGAAIANSLTAAMCGADLLTGIIKCGRDGIITITP